MEKNMYLFHPFLMIDRLRNPTSINLDWKIVLKYEYLAINNITYSIAIHIPDSILIAYFFIKYITHGWEKNTAEEQKNKIGI